MASLSLHYFPWDETVRIVDRVRAALVEGGILVCRLNSTEDRHFGAQSSVELEPGLFEVDGQAKRFFDREAVLALFSVGWDVFSLEHMVTTKYVRPKAAWEVIVQKTPG